MVITGELGETCPVCGHSQSQHSACAAGPYCTVHGCRCADGVVHDPPKPFFDWLAPRDGHVVDELARHEIVFAEDQPEYTPLRALPSRTGERKVLSRWTLTPQQRAAIFNGADIFLELMTFGHPLQPIRMAVSSAPPAEEIREDYDLPPILPETLTEAMKDLRSRWR